VQYAAGKAATASGAASPVILLTQGVLKTMVVQKLRVAFCILVAAFLAAAGAGVWAQQASQGDSGTVTDSAASEATEPEYEPAPEVDPALFLEADDDDAEELEETQKAASGASRSEAVSSSKGDGKPDGKRSLGGSGEMISLEMPEDASKVAGVKIHGSRYGQPQAPKESFLIFFLNKERTRIIHTEMAPYSLFKRGSEEWVEVKFESPLADLPKSFWVVLDFRAAQTKGVYVSFDTATGGKFSRVGLPGTSSSPVNFSGDWMIEGIFSP
jgi:RNA polymerase sigma-70 factor (ECF subfamily)